MVEIYDMFNDVEVVVHQSAGRRVSKWGVLAAKSGTFTEMKQFCINQRANKR